MLGALLLMALPFVIDGGDLERQPPLLVQDQAVCQEAVAEIKESRRLLRNTLVTGGLVAFANLGLDLGSTAWFDHRYACRNAGPGQLCLVEWNTLNPTSVGLIASEIGITLAITGASYLFDRTGHRGWATFMRWLGVSVGTVRAGWNVYQGLRIESTR